MSEKFRESKAEFQARVRREHPERFNTKAEHKIQTKSINKALSKYKEPTAEEIKKHNEGGFRDRRGKFHHNRAWNE